MTTPLNDLTGLRFGRLVADAPITGVSKYGTYWRCICDCGKVHYAHRSALRYGRTRSCGCLRRDTTRKNRKRFLLCKPPTPDTILNPKGD